MSGRGPWGWYPPAPKKPPPKRGIKMKKSGSTWWGQRWVEALEHMSYGYSSRLARGRTYARAGRTHDLVVKDSKATAKVTGSRSRPYKVTISLAGLTDEVWNEAIAAMAAKAQFSAELLAGQMPQGIDAAFKTTGGSLFPLTEADLTTTCSCPDWANPCKHVAATHYVLGEAFDRDPFLLFELRGRSKAQVLEALRAARADGGTHFAGTHEGAGAAESPAVPTVALGRIKIADWDTPPEQLPALTLSFKAPPALGSLLRQLGTPSGWSSDTSPAEALGPMIRAAAERARSLAMAEAPTEQTLESATVVQTAQVAASAKKTSAKKTSAKKTSAKKTSAKKTSAKKTSAKKTSAKKTSAKKTSAKPGMAKVKRTTGARARKAR